MEDWILPSHRLLNGALEAGWGFDEQTNSGVEIVRVQFAELSVIGSVWLAGVAGTVEYADTPSCNIGVS